MMVVVHLTSSRFFGGPERQMLGLAQALPPSCRTVIVTFPEDGHCHPFLEEARQRGLHALALENDTPYFFAALDELTNLLRHTQASVLCCHGYKANLLGRLAARRTGVAVIAVARGWTGENLRVRLYEAMDRIGLRWMDQVVCVSAGQAAKVRQAGVPQEKTRVIHNAIRTERFAEPDPGYRGLLQQIFPLPRSRIIGAAGRLSPEKGFGVLIDAAATLARRDQTLGFVLFGEGPLRDRLARRIELYGLTSSFILAGFRADLDRFLPFLDLLVLPSFTEGLPNVVLEAMAAGVPVVATAVGGTPELIEDGVNGYLVPPGEPQALAARLHDLLTDEQRMQALGQAGRRTVLERFTFEGQGREYQDLFASLTAPPELREAG